jgi:hypothetical protein
VPNPSSHLTLISAEKINPEDTSRISRRDFGRHAAVAAAFALSPGMALGSPQSSPQESKQLREIPDRGLAGLTAEQSEEVEARLTNIIRKYGNRLSIAQRDHLRRILAYNEKMLVSIRAFPLQNGDPPASVLKASFLEQTASSGIHAAARSEGSRR